jgi:hypothetical protein
MSRFSIPSITDMKTRAAVTAAEKEAEAIQRRQKIEEAANTACNTLIEKAANEGRTSCSCSMWVSDEYKRAARELGYRAEFVDVCDDGEGGRMYSFEAVGESYTHVSWETITSRNQPKVNSWL